MLKPITEEDLIFSYEIENDRTNTYVELNDYDWMQYLIKTRFTTKDQGILDIQFEYCGMIISSMTVEQILNNETKKIVYAYSTDIFKKNLITFLKAHIKSLENTYAFNGEKLVINFFNEVLESGYLTDGKDLTKKIPN